MMKKFLAILLCALTLLTGAIAETQEAPAWRVVLDEIEISYQGKAVSLNPALELLIGQEADGLRGQISLLLDGAAVVTMQAEYASNALAVTAEGAKDVLVIEGTDVFLQQYGLTAADLDNALGALLAALTGTTAMLPADAFEGITVLGDRELRADVEMEGVSVSVHLLWEPCTDGVPAISADKNPCRYTYREMFPGDGTDIPETVMAQLQQLLLEPSVVAAMQMFNLSGQM